MEELDAPAVKEPRRTAWLDRVPSWTFLAILGGLLLLPFLLSWLAPDVFWHPPQDFGLNDPRCDTTPDKGGGFFWQNYWRPILCDEGYNPYNTATWAVLLGLMLLWANRLTTEMKERVDFGLILAVTPFLVWGSVYRVLEDSDLFAPYCKPSPSETCAQVVPALGTSFLDSYLGVFFITPIIYVEITFIAVGLLVWGHHARRVAESRGLAYGFQYFALSLILLAALYVALWASGPKFIRYLVPPWVALAAAAPSYWMVHRLTHKQGRFNPHVALAAYGLFFLILGLAFVLVWMTGGVPTWQPQKPNPLTFSYPIIGAMPKPVPVQWWIFIAMIVAPALIAYSTWRKGRIFGGRELATPPPKTEPPKKYGRIVTVLSLILLVEALAVFLTILGMKDLAQRQIAGDWTNEAGDYPRTIALFLAGPVAITLGSLVARRLALRGFVHDVLVYYSAPVNLLMVLGQTTDALMTSLGIDLFNYTEKHVLPRFLIERVDALNLPQPMGSFPTAMVMIPLKLLIVLLVVVAIDASADRELRGRENLIGLVKLGIIMVGLSPGVRDGVRLAMAT